MKKLQNGDIYSPYKLFQGFLTPNSLARRKDISSGAKLLFGRLAQYAGKDGKAYPSQETLARELGVSTKTVRNYTNELIKKHLIIKIGSENQSTNIYRFIWNNSLEDKKDNCKVINHPASKDNHFTSNYN